jgi:hypothetical protein
MNTSVKISLSDDQMRMYKEIFGEVPSRANIRYRTAKMFFEKLGSETPSKDALKSTGVKFAKTTAGRKRQKESSKKGK